MRFWLVSINRRLLPMEGCKGKLIGNDALCWVQAFVSPGL